GPGGEGEAQLKSHVPANVYGCINLIALGAIKISNGRSECLPNQFITGPFTAPLPTSATAPLHSLSIVVYPWVLREWFGADVPSMVNAIQDIEFLPGNSVWHKSVGEEILAAVDHPELLGNALAGLGTLSSGPPERVNSESLMSCLLSAGSISAAAQKLDLSERQFERNFKRYMGLPPKLWLRIKRFEDALVSMAIDQDSGLAGLGGIAADTGFSDQAHMSREFRAISGATPLALQKGLYKKSPGYWAFQPANVGFLQDSQLSKT
ncbi:MAG TPA: helix-turn-helix domain-containing protein, partial [Gallionella sp.]|nr:helix-turn-helix domain-containing protein [Gallionella sp.]